MVAVLAGAAILALVILSRIARAVETIAREAVEQREMTQRATDELRRAKADYEEARHRLGETVKRYESAADDYHTKAAMLAAPLPGAPS